MYCQHVHHPGKIQIKVFFYQILSGFLSREGNTKIGGKMRLKGTVRVISSDRPFIDWHVQFTTIPLKPLFD